MVIGLLIGLVPHSVERTTVPPLSCGSPWFPDLDDAESQDDVIDAVMYRSFRLPASSDYAEQCEDSLGSLGTFAAVLCVFGAMMVVGVGFLVAARPGGSGAAIAPVAQEQRAASTTDQDSAV